MIIELRFNWIDGEAPGYIDEERCKELTKQLAGLRIVSLKPAWGSGGCGEIDMELERMPAGPSAERSE